MSQLNGIVTPTKRSILFGCIYLESLYAKNDSRYLLLYKTIMFEVCHFQRLVLMQ